MEDEGAGFNDLLLMRKLTKKAGLKLDVKIGGCEAKNDIYFCKKIAVDGMVAPMVELTMHCESLFKSSQIKRDKIYI